MPTSGNAKRRLGWLRRLIVLCALICGAPVLAQAPDASPAAAAAGAANAAAEIAARRAELEKDLARVERELASLPEGDPRSDALREERTRLRAVQTLLRQEQTLADDLAPRQKSPESAPTPKPEEPASVFSLNDLYEKQLSAEKRLATRNTDLSASRDALAAAKERLEDKKRRRREAKADLEAAADPVARAAAQQALHLAEMDVREASERVNLRQLEQRAAQRKVAAAEAKIPDLSTRIDALRAVLQKGGGNPSEGLAALTRREGDLRREREGLERDLATAELRLDAAQRRFAKVAEPSDELLEEVDVLSLRRDVLRQQIAAIDAQLERIDAQRTDWKRWSQVLANAASRHDLRAWQDEAEEKIAALEQEELQRQGRSTDIRQQLEDVESRLAEMPPGAKTRRLVEERRDLLARSLDVQTAEDRDLAAYRRLNERLLASLNDRIGHFDVVEYAQRIGGAVLAVWRYELTSVEENPITVGSLFTALLLAVLGLIVSRRIAALVGRLASERFHLDRGAAAALQTLAFYAFLATFTLLALRAVNFPLTAFTVLGGALAIGIGFGSQNVMNNFISGLILMLERPVRALDLVEVDGNHGTVEKIGARSTQIRSTDGRYIIVPNSFFLENNVVNWTLSDDLIRARVSVGVVYGSPTRLVERLIREVVVANENILNHPEPVVIFEDFGDNALIFQTYFWVRARTPMQINRIQSEVRFAIDEIFRQHSLVIAFPQRDVHLDGVGPIEVRMIGGTGGAKTPDDEPSAS